MSRRKQYRPVRVQEEDDKINDNIKSGATTTKTATNNSTKGELPPQPSTTTITTTTEDEKGASSSNVVKSIIAETTKVATTATTKTIGSNVHPKTLKKLIVNENLLLASQLAQERRDPGGSNINGEYKNPFLWYFLTFITGKRP